MRKEKRKNWDYRNLKGVLLDVGSINKGLINKAILTDIFHFLKNSNGTVKQLVINALGRAKGPR